MSIEKYGWAIPKSLFAQTNQDSTYSRYTRKTRPRTLENPRPYEDPRPDGIPEKRDPEPDEDPEPYEDPRPYENPRSQKDPGHNEYEVIGPSEDPRPVLSFLLSTVFS